MNKRDLLIDMLSRITIEDGANNPYWYAACEYAADHIRANMGHYRERWASLQTIAEDGRRVRNNRLAELGIKE